jgi:ATP-dependent helicase/DNAse subunit B
LEGRRLQALMHEWLEVENERSDFQVQAREHEISLKIAPLEITLRVDRIDRLADGSQLIIDYKSGRCDVGDWLGERPAKPQLLLYGIAAATDAQAPPVSALAFARVRARDCAYVGAGRIEAAPGIRTDIVKLVGEKIQAEDWDSLNSAWREILEQLVANFVAGDAAVDPLSPSSCSYCGLQSFCRIGATG